MHAQAAGAGLVQRFFAPRVRPRRGGGALMGRLVGESVTYRATGKPAGGLSGLGWQDDAAPTAKRAS